MIWFLFVDVLYRISACLIIVDSSFRVIKREPIVGLKALYIGFNQFVSAIGFTSQAAE